MKREINSYLRILSGLIAVLIMLFVLSLIPNNNSMNKECKQAVKIYMASVHKLDKGDVEITKGDTITVDYIGQERKGDIFDTSVESIAKACGSFQVQRNYTQGLSFEVGAGQMISGFDAGVKGMKLGETKILTLTPDMGYGEYDEDQVFSLPIPDDKDSLKLKVGDQVPNPFGGTAVVKEITDEEVLIDMNHALVGKTLLFTVTIKEIK